jgi:DNA-directed RNA polymerase subunit L
MNNIKILINDGDEIMTDDKMIFEINNVNICVVNSLRRAVLSNIETLVFRGTPHNSSNINIIKNITNFNNEFLKHRISCIPIFHGNLSIESIENIKKVYKISVNVSNPTNEVKYVTTEDIQFISKITNQPVKFNEHGSDKESDLNKLKNFFPMNKFSKDYILICPLYPNHNKEDSTIETLHFEAEFDIGTAKENPCWNVVHNCTYQFKRDEAKILEKMNAMRKDDKNDEVEIMDFKLLDADRIYHKNQYKFTIQTLGIYENNEIVTKACNYLIEKLNIIINTKNYINVNGSSSDVNDDASDYYRIYQENNFYVFELMEDDYTIGKLIEEYLYQDFVLENDSKISFIGFKKNHPNEPNAFIYIKYKNDNVRVEELFSDLRFTINKIIDIYENIKKQLSKIY